MKPDQYRNVYFYHDQVAGGSGYFKKTGRAKAVMVWRGLSIVAYDRTRAQLKRLASRIKADRALFGRTTYQSRHPMRRARGMMRDLERFAALLPPKADLESNPYLNPNQGQHWGFNCAGKARPDPWTPRPSFGDTFAKISVGFAAATTSARAAGMAFRGLQAVGERLRQREEELKAKYGPDVFAKAVELAKVTLYSPEQICEMDKALKEGRTLDLQAITPQPAYYWQT